MAVIIRPPPHRVVVRISFKMLGWLFLWSGLWDASLMKKAWKRQIIGASWYIYRLRQHTFPFFKNRVFGWLISGLPSPTFLHAPHMKFAYKQVASKQVLFSKTFSTQLEIPCALHTQSHIYSPGSWLRISEPSDNTSSRARWGSYSSHERNQSRWKMSWNFSWSCYEHCYNHVPTHPRFPSYHSRPICFE